MGQTGMFPLDHRKGYIMRNSINTAFASTVLFACDPSKGGTGGRVLEAKGRDKQAEDTKAVEAAVTAAIKSSVNHEPVLKAGVIAACLFGLNYGRWDQMQRLFKEVRLGDREAIRFYFVGVSRSHGYKHITESGAEQFRLPFTFRAADGTFATRQPANETEKEACAKSRDSILAAGEAGLSVIGFGRLRVENDNAGTEVDVNAWFAKQMERAAQRGMKLSTLEQMAKLLPDTAPKPDLITAADKGKVSAADVAKAKAAFEKKQKKFEASQPKGQDTPVEKQDAGAPA